MPARRSAASLGAAVALAAGALALGPASPAAATEGSHGGSGKAGAVVLRTGLDVSLLNKTVDVPLDLTLNEVQAPASADETALTATLDGVDRGRPFSVLQADVATARATVDRHKAEGYANLVHARVHVPGLPLIGLIKADAITSRATCEAGERPVADTELPGWVTVLGKRVRVTAGGPTEVRVPGVGEVRLDLAKRVVTSRTAAATALELNVSIDPLKLNVADVKGTVTLVQATCETPGRGGGGDHGGGHGGGHDGDHGGGHGGGKPGGDDEDSATPTPQPGDESEPPSTSAEPSASPEPVDAGGSPGSAPSAQAVAGNLAETGSSSMTPYLAGGSVLLFAVGFVVIRMTRRRTATQNARD
ncbi:SCO1860 family LAETG-anchored protein [Streptomyces sp. MI02-7b]|uniref:SCO1860 family LAETG-anchored protein n=1 Tax=Streptomyces sp. MI02-7b TaxID=462941 RepID=UPI0029BB89B6|nr:SCO1860 family LAETG-anchored protein [Streptomyces sp. MI02-7b]MDX3074422.1 SCO1860 family LAETG-anchored protein [Streptomyces sp. MI02-7b]